MIKKILIAVGVLVVLLIVAFAAMTLIAPADYSVEKEIVINRPRAQVFEYARMVKHQNDWGPWFKQDPAMKQEFVGTDGTPGFISKWVSTKVGSGEQEITKVVPNERLETELRFTDPFESRSQAYMLTEDAGPNQTKVKWGLKGAVPRPMNAMLLFFDINEAIGKDYSDGLASLKTILESR
jgi:uncharacterized protein YndB with AHSA1/START domain